MKLTVYKLDELYDEFNGLYDGHYVIGLPRRTVQVGTFIEWLKQRIIEENLKLDK